MEEAPNHLLPLQTLQEYPVLTQSPGVQLVQLNHFDTMPAINEGAPTTGDPTKNKRFVKKKGKTKRHRDKVVTLLSLTLISSTHIP